MGRAAARRFSQSPPHAHDSMLAFWWSGFDAPTLIRVRMTSFFTVWPLDGW